MKADGDLSRAVPAASEAKLFVGRFVRRQGSYGTIAVVGRMGDRGVDVLDDPKRLFPRDGFVETRGITHTRLAAGDWIAFDVVRNERPRAAEYRAVHLHQLPRYAALPDATMATHRALLTSEGWRGDRRPGLWALRISGDRVLVVELEAGKVGGLRIPRESTRKVLWCGYSDDLVSRLPTDKASENVFIADPGRPSGIFDWSNEVDHVAQVIRSMSDVDDPHVSDLISWLELHHGGGTAQVFTRGLDHDAAQAALRSGELAMRLRADRELMKVYLDAALQDDAVREAVAEWAREGHGAETARLHGELEREIASERKRRVTQLTAEIDRETAEALERIKNDAGALADQQRQALAAREREAEEGLATRLRGLNARFDERKAALKEEIARQQEALAAVRGATEVATGDLERVRADTDDARIRLRDIVAEVDRLIAIADRLGVPAPAAAPARGVMPTFIERPLANAGTKGLLIGHAALLTDKGKDLLHSLATLLMAGELPMLTGNEASDFLQIAEVLICPGRSVEVEADPTIISIDDLWSRPGSGAPTAMATAAAAAGSGAALVTIRGIERSGARFWVPALANALRGGSLPRGLLVCCLVGDREHDEVAALPRDLHWLEIEGAITDSAFLGAPSLLRPPALELTTLDPGPAPGDLSEASTLIATLGFWPQVGQAMRIARMFVEAKALLGDDNKARALVKGLARAMEERVS